MTRRIIEIDQNKCEGCGTCVTACSKGAIQLVDGKAQLIDAEVCDGLGSCLPKCPMYAIKYADSDVLEFDNQKAVNEMLRTMLAGTPPAFPPGAFSSFEGECPCASPFTPRTMSVEFGENVVA